MASDVSLPFDRPVERLRPVSHAGDPATSHQAERHLRESGRLGRQLFETLAALADWPVDTPTSRELGGDDVRLQYLRARRLSDLKRLGYVENGPSRICRRTNELCLTWVLTASGRARLRDEH
jgi:hypothetical protein